MRIDSISEETHQKLLDDMATALQLLRTARNNMYREVYEAEIKKLCEDGDLRYPLILAGNVATGVHKEVLKQDPMMKALIERQERIFRYET